MSHIKLSKAEQDLLVNRIDTMRFQATTANGKRMQRARDLLARWNNAPRGPEQGDTEQKSNFQVPLVQWTVFARLASTIQQLLGSDAEIIARPVGPADQQNVAKIGRFMSWMVFSYMNITLDMVTFVFRTLLFGRCIAYVPWELQKRDGEVFYDGPRFIPLAPHEVLVPSESGAKCVHDLSWVIRRHWPTPQSLLEGERDGRYTGITEHFQDIVTRSLDGSTREPEDDDMQSDLDEAEGVLRDQSGIYEGERIEVHEVYMRHRLPKGKGGGDYHDLSKRELDQTEIVVHYIPSMKLIIGVQRLDAIYRKLRHRRPFVEAAMVADGTYWSKGIGELVQDIESESTAIHNMFTDAGMMTAGPVVFYRPSSGFSPESFKYQPFTAYPTEDPASITQMKFQSDFNFAILANQQLNGIVERVTGVSDSTMGRAIDRPNAPRTATGQMALLEQGNVRANLDTSIIREYMNRIVAHLWEMETEFGSEQRFFRVTEEEAKGLFEVSQGGATITEEERAGRYDFAIQMATTVWSKEQKKQERLSLFQLDLTNPLIVQNPRALWMVTNELHKAFGDDNFHRIIPEPPDLGQPKSPKEEWVLMLQGDDVEPNPLDNDDLHIMDHIRRMNEHAQSRNPDRNALQRMAAHIAAQRAQKQQKAFMQAMANQLATNLASDMGGGLTATGGTPMPIQNLQQALTDITGQPTPTAPSAPPAEGEPIA